MLRVCVNIVSGVLCCCIVHSRLWIRINFLADSPAVGKLEDRKRSQATVRRDSEYIQQVLYLPDSSRNCRGTVAELSRPSRGVSRARRWYGGAVAFLCIQDPVQFLVDVGVSMVM